MRIAVLLPCHNEEVTVGMAVEQFRSALPDAEIWVCDNASSDGTAVAARAAGARVVRETRVGKGNAIRRLFADVEADVYVMADGDSTYDAGSAPVMVDALLENSLDMVVGSRLHSAANGQFRPGHHFGNRLFSTVVRWFFGSTLSDLLSGYRVMSRRFVKSFPAESRGFEVETELTVVALEARCPITEVPTPYRARPHGSESKLSTYRDGARILRTVFLLLRDVRPLEFFCSLAGGLILGGVAMFVPILGTFAATHRVPRIPTLMGITGMWVLAMIFITCGVILDRIAAARRAQHRLSYLRFAGPATATALDDANELRGPLAGGLSFGPE